jgi:O-antigen/teichoic acid export membrane protein
MLIGIALSRRAILHPAPRLEAGEDDLLKSGALLLFVGMLPSAVGVLVGVILALVSGPDALGYLEAARIVAQPILVFAIGLSAVLGPRSMRAARARARGEARRLARQFGGAVLGLGIVYAAIVGFPNPLNGLAWLIPKAYTVPGVVALTVAGHVALSLAMPVRSEMLGAGRIGPLAWIEAVANLANIACASLAGLVGIFALPMGMLAQGTIRLALLRVQSARLYREGPDVAGDRPDGPPAISDWSDGSSV